MINILKGIVRERHEEGMVLQVGGFGLNVNVPNGVILPTGSECELHTYMHWNQENGPQLFGFSDAVQRDFFCLLITVSGIGPRMALALLSAYSVSTLVEALLTGNIGLLSSVSGIGRKKAETIILHLKDKAAKFVARSQMVAAPTGFARHMKDLNDALTSLGYSSREIMHAVDQLKTAEGASEYAFDQLLRKSLQLLSRS